jgi:catechol 2,3-dioxygenase-like lactoylglutathione lyase family enzyme
VDHLLKAYERGKLTRRQLLASLVAAGASAPSVSAQDSTSLLRGRASRNQHTNLFVSNIRQTVEFYTKLGMPNTVRPMYPRAGEAAYALDFTNGSFLSLIQTNDKNRVGRIDHFCIGIDNFDFTKDVAAIRAAGIKVTEAEFNLIHMTDPDGIGVQMTDAKNNLDCPKGIGYPPCSPLSAPRR